MVNFAGLHEPTSEGLWSRETHLSSKFPVKQEEDNVVLPFPTACSAVCRGLLFPCYQGVENYP